MPRSKFVRIEVKDSSEGESIQRALADPMTRAFVVIVGTLLPFGAHDRTRILTFVNDKLDEKSSRVSIESTGDDHTLSAALPLPTAQ